MASLAPPVVAHRRLQRLAPPLSGPPPALVPRHWIHG